ncbi:MAG: peptidylprolyl isomerase [Rhizobium sp.]|nr:peptidylprolyl isomerase [Rhizobium sp.]MBX9459058.1 peptidylprolyl isomerase [Rhizobium sp.]
MYRNKLIAAAALVVLTGMTLPALAQDAKDPVIARIDGVEVTQSDLNLAMDNLDPQLAQLPDEQKKLAALSTVIDAKLIAEKARAEKLQDTAEFKNRLEFIIDRELHNAYFKKHVVDTITDADVKARYDAEIAKLPPVEEVRARHILVKTEDEAKTVLKELGEGKDFAELAKIKSTDPNKSDGGDLGYFKKGMMVPEFEKAAFEMNKGDVSKAPIKTQFGFHVIKVEDKRNAPPPEFDQVKEQVKQIVLRDKYMEVLKTSKSAAKIEIDDPALKKLYDETNAQPAK